MTDLAQKWLDALPDAILIAKAPGYVRFVNKAWRERFAANVRIVEGGALNDVVPETADLWHHLIECAAKGVVQGDVDHWNSGAAIAPFSWSATVLDQETVIRAAHTTGVSEPTAPVEDRRDTNDRFFSAVAHDLRTAVRKIRTFSEMLGSALGSNDLGRASMAQKKVLATTMGLQKTLTGLLELARQGESVEQSDFGIDEAYMSVVDELEIDIEQSGAILAPVAPLPIVRSNRVLIEQIFRNLLSNSLRFRRSDRSLVVSLTCEFREAALVLVFEDTGRGFDPRYAEAIFEPFRQIQTVGQPDGAMGLGLSLVQRAVEDLGGSISAHSSAGEGARFVIQLPAHIVVEGNATDNARGLT